MAMIAMWANSSRRLNGAVSAAHTRAEGCKDNLVACVLWSVMECRRDSVPASCIPICGDATVSWTVVFFRREDLMAANQALAIYRHAISKYRITILIEESPR